MFFSHSQRLFLVDRSENGPPSWVVPPLAFCTLLTIIMVYNHKMVRWGFLMLYHVIPWFIIVKNLGGEKPPRYKIYTDLYIYKTKVAIIHRHHLFHLII